MSQVITIPFTQEFLPHVLGYLQEKYLSQGRDLSRVAIVFGGKRPSLFLKRDLARLIGKAFIPPTFFTMDEWMAYVAYQEDQPVLKGPLDHAYILFQLAKAHCPRLLVGRSSFAQFLPWAREITHFIEQLDLEDLPLAALENLKAHADLGFAVPDDINKLLASLAQLRLVYHDHLRAKGFGTRGMGYLQASRLSNERGYEAFEEILFCNFFYLHRTENTVIKAAYDKGKAVLFLQGDERRWPALRRMAKSFGTPVIEGKEVAPTSFDLKLYEATDAHAQAAMVRTILQDIDDPQSTVVVLPHMESLLPLLSVMDGQIKEFNVSLGYPLKRSALYALMSLLLRAQQTRRQGAYYAHDYLAVMLHPLVKHIQVSKSHQPLRSLVHRIEEALTGKTNTAITGMLFINLDEILKDEAVFEGVDKDAVEALKQVHEHLLGRFSNIASAKELALALIDFINFMQVSSPMGQYPLNEAIAVELKGVVEELLASAFCEEPMNQQQLFSILEERLEDQIVAFHGSPLRGLQILGLFETRALNFKNVIVLDVNEGLLPNLNIYEPLIPREVMIKLNLDRLELEEEIQRYGFMRLISSAKCVHLIYQNNRDRLRSRFVEELIWEREQRLAGLRAVDIIRPRFMAGFKERVRQAEKTKAILGFLEGMRFSASSINSYMNNPYDFYCHYVLGLKHQDDMLEDLESRHIGTFIHDLLEENFKVFIGKKPVIDDAFTQRFMRIYEARFAETFGKSRRCDSFLIKTVLDTRLERFLKAEAKRCQTSVKEIMFIERRFEDELLLGDRKVKFSYRVDRVDLMEDGTVMVLDYKTGGMTPMPKLLGKEELLSREEIASTVKSFQMPLYLNYLHRQYPHTAVNAALYHLRTLDIEPFMKLGEVQDVGAMSLAYQAPLAAIVNEIFDINSPFVDKSVNY